MAAGSWPLFPLIKTLQRVQPYASLGPAAELATPEAAENLYTAVNNINAHNQSLNDSLADSPSMGIYRRRQPAVTRLIA